MIVFVSCYYVEKNEESYQTINLFVFQTPDGNEVAKEICLECGFICKDDIFPILIQFQTFFAHLTVWQYCTFRLAFLLIIGLLLCSVEFEHPKCT